MLNFVRMGESYYNPPQSPQCSAHAGTCAPVRSLTSLSLSDVDDVRDKILTGSNLADLPSETLPWPAIRERASAAIRRLYPTTICKTEDTRDLILSGAILAETVLSPGWFEGAIAATAKGKKVRNIPGFLKRCLENRLAEYEGLCDGKDNETRVLYGRLLAQARPHVRYYHQIEKKHHKQADRLQEGGFDDQHDGQPETEEEGQQANQTQGAGDPGRG